MPNPIRLVARVAVFLGLIALLGLAHAQGVTTGRSPLEQNHIAEVRRLYGASTWASSVARAGVPNVLALDGWRAGPLQCEQGFVTRTFRHAQGRPSAPSFLVETRVADDVAGAQDQLIEWLAGVQSAARMPSVADLGLVLGDAGFAGRSGAGPGVLAWIAFVRGNVAVRVVAFDAPREPTLDLGGIALAVDRAIEAVPVLEAGRALAKPEVDLPAAAAGAVTAGAVLPLDVTIHDPAQGRPHVRWIVGGPGQGYVEPTGTGGWALHTTGPGALTLTLEVTGSQGTWTRRDMTLQVLDDR